MHDVLRFWMDRGVDGLRLDAIAKIAKDPLLRDHVGRLTPPRRGLGVDPPAPARHPQGHRRIRGPDDRGGGGAAGPAPRRRATSSPATSCTSRTTSSSSTRTGARSATRTASPTSRQLAEEHAWPAWFLANHDKNRPRSRFDHDGLGAAARPRDPRDALHAARHAVHLPGRGARAAGRDDPARPRRRRRRPRPRARADPVDARRARPRLHDGGDAWLPFIDDAATLNAADPGRGPATRRCNLTRALAHAARARRPALRHRRAGAGRRGPGHRRLDTRGDELPGRGQLHRPGAAAGRRGRARALQRPGPEDGERLARRRARRSSCDATRRRATRRSRRRRSAASSRRARPRSARRP